MAHLCSNKTAEVCHSSKRVSSFIVLCLFVYLLLDELMRALQATLIQFDHNCPQYSVIDVATTKTSSCDVLVPALQQQQRTHTHTRVSAHHHQCHLVTTWEHREQTIN